MGLFSALKLHVLPNFQGFCVCAWPQRKLTLVHFCMVELYLCAVLVEKRPNLFRDKLANPDQACSYVVLGSGLTALPCLQPVSAVYLSAMETERTKG